MRFTDEEVDTLIEILDDKIAGVFINEAFGEYYGRDADLSQAIRQLLFSNEIKNPGGWKEVKAEVEKITEQRLADANDDFKIRATARDKADLLSDVKRTCEEAAEYLGILIKLETQEETVNPIKTNNSKFDDFFNGDIHLHEMLKTPEKTEIGELLKYAFEAGGQEKIDKRFYKKPGETEE